MAKRKQPKTDESKEESLNVEDYFLGDDEMIFSWNLIDACSDWGVEWREAIFSGYKKSLEMGNLKPLREAMKFLTSEIMCEMKRLEEGKEMPADSEYTSGPNEPLYRRLLNLKPKPIKKRKPKKDKDKE